MIASFSLLAMVLVSMVVYKDWYDAWISDLYAFLLSTSFFRFESFEVVQSSLCFALWTSIYVIMDFVIPDITARYRITISTDKNTRENEMFAWKGRERALVEETAWYTITWIVFDAFFPRREQLLNAYQKPPTIESLVIEILCSLCLYDVFFYAGHRLFHASTVLYQSIHAKHHTSKGQVKACDAFRHTFIDGTWNVLCSVFALRIVRSHPLARMLHNVIATYLITEIHSGYDWPLSLSKATFGFFQSASEHQKHHMVGNCNYSQLTTILDKLCGSYQY
jgi:sterol desaturase/sphingolipid hydroxylase (fatty acid hydroxylase superfamily)